MAGQNITKAMGLLQTGNSIRTNFAKNSSVDKGFKNILDSNSNLPDKKNSGVENEKLNSQNSKDKTILTEPKSKEQIKNVNVNQTQNEPLNSKKVEETEESSPNVNLNIQDLENAVKASVLEVLNLSEEELEIVMSELGIGLLDLLKPNNLKDLILKVNETDDMLQLVTNSDMTNQLKDLFSDVQNIKEDFKIGNKDITDLIKNQTNLKQEYVPPSELEIISDDIPKESQNAIVNNDNVETLEKEQPKPVIINEMKQNNTDGIKGVDKELSEENKDIPKLNNLDEDNNTINYPEETLTEEKIIDVKQQHILPKEVNKSNETIKEIHSEVEIIDDDFSKTSELKPKEIKIEVSTGGLKESGQNNSSNFNESNQESHDNKLNTFINNLVQNISNDQENINLNQVKQFREIINQIVEQIKVSVKPDTSSMEIQLNPEHLGKINLQVVAKDGVLSAQFTAQTQIAKEAIESQIVTLKENLNNQGLKVEAIEVTIGTSGFDQSNQANSSNQGESKQSKRKLSMEQINALIGDDDLTEEEKIAVDIMRQNGSSIDYTA